MRRRFFVQNFTGNSAIVEGDTAHHLGDVLRAQKGQVYELSDGATAWLGRIETVSRHRVEFTLVEQLPATMPSAEITLLLSIVKFDAFEWALEKATELGVVKVVPVAAARSEKGLVAAAAKRSERWRKILLESSQQSRRLRVPELAPLPRPFEAFAIERGGFRVLFSERPDAPHIRAILASAAASKPAVAVVAIGPEGGWTHEEIASARAADFREASLGPLILRTETAVISALSVLNFALAPATD